METLMGGGGRRCNLVKSSDSQLGLHHIIHISNQSTATDKRILEYAAPMGACNSQPTPDERILQSERPWVLVIHNQHKNQSGLLHGEPVGNGWTYIGMWVYTQDNTLLHF